MKKRTGLYKLLQWTWGLPQTLLGAGVYLKHRRSRHFDYGGARVTLWDRDDGISLGRYIFVPEKKSTHKLTTSDRKLKSDPPAAADRKEVPEPDAFLLTHEYGHTFQSLLLGPFYLLLVGFPSVLWNRLPLFRSYRKKSGRSYYSAIFERTATALGERAEKKNERG